MVTGLNQKKKSIDKRGHVTAVGRKDMHRTITNSKKQNALLWKDGKSTACRGKNKQRQVVNQWQVTEDDDAIEHFLNGLNDSTSRPMLQVCVKRKKIAMEVDTGAAVSVIPIGKLIKAQVRPSTKRLKSATGQLFSLTGELTVRVQVESTTKVMLFKANVPHVLAETGSRHFSETSG